MPECEWRQSSLRRCSASGDDLLLHALTYRSDRVWANQKYESVTLIVGLSDARVEIRARRKTTLVEEYLVSDAEECQVDFLRKQSILRGV